MTIAADSATAERALAQCTSLLRQSGAQQVLELADHVLTSAPLSVAAHVWRGLALKDLARLEDARGAFEQALRIDAGCMPAHTNRAAILRRLGRSEDALAACDAALAVQPGFAIAHCNRGLALNDLDRPAEALQEFDRAIALAPDFAAAHGNRGKTLHTLSRFDDALAAYRRVMVLEPDSAQVHLNASHTCLLMGQLEQGFAWYEWRKQLSPGPAGAGHTPSSSLGTAPIRGKTLLLQAEQGLGDTIQFCRYARVLRDGGASVVLAVQPPLARLLRSLGSDIEVCAQPARSARADHNYALLSMPLALRTTLGSIPAAVPYLRAEPGRVERWRAVIGRHGFRIGINWQGNPKSPVDRGRSLPLALFEGLASLPGVRLISLQHGAGREQIEGCRGRFELQTLPAEFDRGGDAFVDSAAALESLDLLITSDTALAHLAGALARPTWLALPRVADWRWLDQRVDSPWYPSMRLFRQRQRGQWADVFTRMRAELAAALGT